MELFYRQRQTSLTKSKDAFNKNKKVICNNKLVTIKH